MNDDISHFWLPKILPILLGIVPVNLLYPRPGQTRYVFFITVHLYKLHKTLHTQHTISQYAVDVLSHLRGLPPSLTYHS